MPRCHGLHAIHCPNKSLGDYRPQPPNIPTIENTVTNLHILKDQLCRRQESSKNFGRAETHIPSQIFCPKLYGIVLCRFNDLRGRGLRDQISTLTSIKSRNWNNIFRREKGEKMTAARPPPRDHGRSLVPSLSSEQVL